MARAGWAPQRLAQMRPPAIAGFIRLVLAIAVALLVYVICARVVQMYGLPGLAVATGVLVLLSLLAVLSLHNLELAILVWVISIAGFRGLLILDLPGMPDATPDRLLLIWIAAVLVLRAFAKPGKPMPPYSIDVLVALHAIYLLGSCLIANPTAFNLWTRSYLMPAAGYFFGKYMLSDRMWFRRLAALLIIINLYMGFTSIAEHMGWSALVWPPFIRAGEKGFAGRSLGIFLQPGVLGVFIGMVLPLQFYLHLTARSFWVRWAHMAGILMCMLGLFFTYTRGPWLATGVGLVVLALTGSRVYLRRLAIYGLAAAIIGATGTLSLKQDTFFQERINNENTIEGRINIMYAAFRMWQANPVLGVGFKRFNDRASDFREAVEVPIYGMIKSGIDRDSSPHDIYIAVLAEEGAVGAGMQFWFYVLMLKVGLDYVRRRKGFATDEAWHAATVPLLLAAMATYFVGGTAFDYRFFETLNSIFYLFCGILVGWSAMGSRSLATVRSVTS